MADENNSDAQKHRNIQNNANNIRNAAEVAIASKNPYGMAIGGAIKAADKISGGKSTEKLGKAMNTASKISPVGRKIQNFSNKLSESETGDKLNKVVAEKNGMFGSKNVNQNSSNTAALNNNIDNNTTGNLTDNSNQNINSNRNLKKKLIIVGVAAPFVFIIIFIVILFTPLIVLGIIDIDDVGSNSSNSYTYGGYVSTTNNTGYWWPIGSLDVSIVDGKQFATGTPSSVKINATFAGDDSTHQGAHGAIDIDAPVNGANVIATMDGVVIYPEQGSRIDYPNGWYNSQTHTCSGDGGGFGNYVKIDHGNGIVSIYGHMYANTITVRAGDTVKQGQVIGKSGTSGCSTGGHLHFEMRLNGTKVDPLDYVSPTEPRRVVKTDNTTDKNSTRMEMEE